MYDRKKFRSAQNVTDVSFFVVKSVCEKQMLTEKLQIDTETEMLARGTLASLSVGDDRRVVQRVKLCVCERNIKRGHMTACREKHI